MKKPKILVVGSLVMDLTVSAEKFPDVGESVFGTDFSTAPGGKGANQAVQAARLGAEVVMVGKVGNDDFGTALLNSLKNSGVEILHITKTNSAPTAVGNIQLQINENGTDNRIIVVPGANYKITEEDVAFLECDIKNYDMVILQNEIPEQINIAVANYAAANSVPVMLNPAPYRPISPELLKNITYISPNEHEALAITGIMPDNECNIGLAVKALNQMGVKKVIITLGKRGCVYSDGENIVYGKSVDCGRVVDTTAAGDSFIAAFCTAVSSEMALEDALKFANCTAGITVSRKGAQPSLPKLDEVEKIWKH